MKILLTFFWTLDIYSLKSVLFFTVHQVSTLVREALLR